VRNSVGSFRAFGGAMGTHGTAGWVGYPATVKTQAEGRQLTRVPLEARDELRVAPEGPKSVAG